MSRIIIRKAIAQQRSVKGKNGTTYNFNEQNAALEKDGEDFPHPFRVRLADGQAPYPAGDYAVAPASFEIGQFGDLVIGRRLQLVPIMPAANPAAPK
ncbi:single-stranded DNA-binding protein [Xanthomonas phaseoli]|uniref:Single-stranded DNA-binding protein n=1 Tax=Xanthomonas phaseoli pv. dieffenbachiae TaxID=92828 RepID=A0A1V9GXF0_9XANT|nr:single-stranded DNA-binding protein [Xanthomonas phaseoli]MBO9788653.1 hypothetical protein [Xanthomonas phaseoli pv. dieffenbachiae]MBO9887155.1 hypothetical protein [Xanthomonas phaseoli pv. dieffenbachiae]MBO9916096.1 hypothetical protein [Xanthomonas phaseoli pv. dieffenbachiae]MBO9937718.1 hypothetical protein [Xanthomonas phaseoli pv. dieffenbachiae]MBO9996279.1 hypothetical protein [Xanthomonas phaseoli pv. dieffenbachiae]